MKKLLFLLVFIPLVSFGQVDSLKDIQGISSLDQFKRVMIENNYQFTEEEVDGWIWYGVTPKKNEDDVWVSGYWGGYNTSTNQWTFQFSKGLFDFAGYDDIFDEVKERCKFFKIVKFRDAFMFSFMPFYFSFFIFLIIPMKLSFNFRYISI